MGSGTASSLSPMRRQTRWPRPRPRGAVLPGSLPAPSEGGGGRAANWGKGRRAALPAAADHALFACPRPDRAPTGAANGGGAGAGRGEAAGCAEVTVARAQRPPGMGAGMGIGIGVGIGVEMGIGVGVGMGAGRAAGRASALPRATELSQSDTAGGSSVPCGVRQTVRVPTCCTPSCRPHGCKRGCMRSRALWEYRVAADAFRRERPWAPRSRGSERPFRAGMEGDCGGRGDLGSVPCCLLLF